MPYASIAYIPDFLSEEGHEKVKEALGRTYDRLVEHKANCDSTNLLSLNQR
jgi:hypothetical protein